MTPDHGMGDETMGDEQEDLAIACALDVEPGGTAGHDDAITSEYRLVATHLPFDEVDPPSDLEARVVHAALDRRPAAATSIDQARDRTPSPPRDERVRRRGAARLVALGAAAAAVIVVVGYMVVSAGDDSGGVKGNLETVSVSANEVAALERAPETRDAPLRAVPDNREAGTALLGADGQGALDELALDPAPSGEHYWLWVTTTGNDAVRVGDLGVDPGATIGYELEGDVDDIAGVLITREPANTAPAVPSATAASGTFEG